MKTTWIVDYYNKETFEWGVVRVKASSRREAMDIAKVLLNDEHKVAGAKKKPNWID